LLGILRDICRFYLTCILFELLLTMYATKPFRDRNPSMKFVRAELNESVTSLLGDADPYLRAMGENFIFEESVSDLRRENFEDIDVAQDVRELADSYFRISVQGFRRGHLPSTLDERLNSEAMLPASIERKQKIIRLERIDNLISCDPALDFKRLAEALKSKEVDVLSEFIKLFHTFPGERPAFVAFKAELADDLKQVDWLDRIIRRLGLLHFFPLGKGSSAHFALMEYTVEDVFNQAVAKGIAQPFAVASVLECRNNPAFFPVPKHTGHGFTVDLEGRDLTHVSPREVLHARIDYVHTHVLRFSEWLGPKAEPNIDKARRMHAAWLRDSTGRGDFAAAPVAGSSK
jgi:hypothetical protein